jgi:hypothetical protein
VREARGGETRVPVGLCEPLDVPVPLGPLHDLAAAPGEPSVARAVARAGAKAVEAAPEPAHGARRCYRRGP